jgi:hypothetical protein
MGGVQEVLPDANVASLTFGWVATGGTLTTAVNDNSDATYITDSSPGSANTRASWTFANTSLPAGAAIKYSYPKIRCSQASGSAKLTGSVGQQPGSTSGVTYQSPGRTFIPTSAIQDVVLTTAGAVPQSKSQAVVNNFFVTVLQYPGSALAEDHRLYRVSVQVQYVDSPTAVGLALFPASANTLTTKPGVQWNFNSTDSFVQYEYRVALWRQADVALFSGGRTAFEAAAANPFKASFVGTDAATKTPVWSTATTAKPDGWTASGDNNVTTTADVVNGVAYTYYVEVSALHAGERLFHPTNIGILDFTESLTTPTVPTSVTPTWQNSPNYRGQVVVAYPTQTLGAWDGRRLIVQARDSTSTNEADWTTLPNGTAEIAASSGSATFYDTLAYQGQGRVYRAKTLLYATATGYTSGSAWVTSSTITAAYDAFVLRDPFQNGTELVAKINGDFTATQDEVQGQFRPIGQPFTVVVSDAILAKRWSVEVVVKDKATETALDLLRVNQSPLMLQTDMAGLLYWVRIGPSIQKRLLRQSDRKTDTKRTQIWTFDLVAVAAPAGQNLGAF